MSRKREEVIQIVVNGNWISFVSSYSVSVKETGTVLCPDIYVQKQCNGFLSGHIPVFAAVVCTSFHKTEIETYTIIKQHFDKIYKIIIKLHNPIKKFTIKIQKLFTARLPMYQLSSQWTVTFENHEPQEDISFLEFDGEFFTPVFVFCVDNLANLPYPNILESLQVLNASGGHVEDADILLVIEDWGCST